MNIKISNREIVLILMTIGAVILFVITQLMIKPLRNDEEDLERQMRINQKLLSQAQNTMAIRASVAKRYDELTALIGTAASQSAEMSSLVAKIESAAGQAKVHIANMQPQRPVPHDVGQFFPVDLQISGAWNNIVRFLHVLQAAPNYFFINEMNLEKQGDSNGLLSGRVVLSRLRLNKK